MDDNDLSAALLPADPSAAVTTEPLPHADIVTMTDRKLEVAISETIERINAQHAHLDRFVTRVAGECFLMVLRAQSELGAHAIAMFERGHEPQVGSGNTDTQRSER